jgi:hypothetical protein
MSPRMHVGSLGTGPVATAELAPDVGALRNVAADALRRDPDQSAEQLFHLPSEPARRVPGPVRERHDADTVVWRQEDL